MMKWILFANAVILFLSGFAGIIAVLSKKLAVSMRPIGFLGMGWALFGLARVGYHLFTGHSLRSTPVLRVVITIACLAPNSAMLLAPKGNNRWVAVATSAGCFALCLFAWAAYRRV